MIKRFHIYKNVLFFWVAITIEQNIYEANKEWYVTRGKAACGETNEISHIFQSRYGERIVITYKNISLTLVGYTGCPPNPALI